MKLLTKWEEFEPQVEYAINKHGVYVDKQNDWVHAGQLEVINRLVHDIQEEIARLCIRLGRILIMGSVALNSKTPCSSTQNVEGQRFWQEEEYEDGGKCCDSSQ